MLIKSPGDGHGAGAQGIGEESPQRRFSGARTWNVKPDPPFFTGGCAIRKIQDSNSKLQIPRMPLRITNGRITNMGVGFRWKVRVWDFIFWI